MPRVSFSIGGKSYEIACAEGEENHIALLAQRVDERVTQTSKAFPSASHSLTMAISALMMEDELHQQSQQTAPQAAPQPTQTPAQAQPQQQPTQPVQQNSDQDVDLAVAEAIEPIAEAIEELAISLETL